jgi:hypothetical protein
MVLETLAFSSLNHLTRLVAREDFIKYRNVEKFGCVCVCVCVCVKLDL